jgi:hypothetical protein
MLIAASRDRRAQKRIVVLDGIGTGPHRVRAGDVELDDGGALAAILRLEDFGLVRLHRVDASCQSYLLTAAALELAASLTSS